MATKKKQQRYALNKNKYLLDPEYDRLPWLLSSHIDTSTRDCTLLSLALHTGARATEILNLKKKDINTYDQSVFITGIKGSDDREIPLKDELFDYLLKVSGLQQGEMVFPISYNRLRQIWEFYRPVHKSFHCLRHTFAIRLYKKTRDIRLLQVALGHRNITNTMIYADYVYSQQELRKLIL